MAVKFPANETDLLSSFFCDVWGCSKWLLIDVTDVGSWREGGGRSMPLAPTTEENRDSSPPSSAAAAAAAHSSEDEETPQAPFHPQSQAAVMAHMMRPGMGPAPRMGPAGPMMYGPMMPPFVSFPEIHVFLEVCAFSQRHRRWLN